MIKQKLGPKQRPAPDLHFDFEDRAEAPEHLMKGSNIFGFRKQEGTDEKTVKPTKILLLRRRLRADISQLDRPFPYGIERSELVARFWGAQDSNASRRMDDVPTSSNSLFHVYLAQDESSHVSFDVKQCRSQSRMKL